MNDHKERKEHKVCFVFEFSVIFWVVGYIEQDDFNWRLTLAE